MKGQDLEVEMIFRDREGKLVVLDGSNSEDGTFRLTVGYKPIGEGQPYLF